MKSSILRDADPIRYDSRTYRDDRTDAPSRTDHKVDAVHEILRDQLAPRIATMSANAARTDRREFYHFRRRKTGRRCSCFVAESSPDKDCPICIGTGIVGGYDKFGTRAEILDYTHPDLIMVNVEPNLDENTRPVYFRLKNEANFGYIEATLPIRANEGIIDTYFLGQPLFNCGARILATAPNASSAYITKPEDWIPFLAYPSVTVRIEMRKGDKRPLVSHLMIRYETLSTKVIWGDIPRSDENIKNSQFGLFDAYSEIGIFFDAKTTPLFEPEDVLYRIYDQRRFKILDVRQNRVASTLTSTDVVARFLIDTNDRQLYTNLLV